MTGIDLESFTRDSQMEPLKTLKTFRQPTGDALKFTQTKNMQHVFFKIAETVLQMFVLKFLFLVWYDLAENI